METTKVSSTVETEITTSTDGKNTYEIKKTFKNREGDKAIVILLYPTKNADNIAADDNTTQHIVSHINDLNLSELRIINLFSKVVTGGKMSYKGLQPDDDNLAYIESIMSKKDFKEYKFVIAWGCSMSSSKVCSECKKRVLEMFIKHSTDGKAYNIVPQDANIDEFAPHPLWLGIRYKFAKWLLNPLKINKNLIDKMYPN